MSVMVLSEVQVAVIARLAVQTGYAMLGDESAVYDKLMWMNQRAAEARYGVWYARGDYDLPEGVHIDYRRVSNLVRSYRYQSCDAPEWPRSYVELLTDLLYRDLVLQFGDAVDRPWTVDSWEQIMNDEPVPVTSSFL